MRTEKQIQASRANGAKSKGPVTLDGKARSSQNAVIHGLTGNLVLKAESQPQFLRLACDYFHQHQPVGQAEIHLVEILVSCHWRENRAWSLETSMFDDETVRLDPQNLKEDPDMPESTIGARTWKSLSDTSSSLALLMRYESNLSRRFFRALKSLAELQAARRAATAEPARTPFPEPKITNDETNPRPPQPPSNQPLPRSGPPPQNPPEPAPTPQPILQPAADPRHPRRAVFLSRPRTHRNLRSPHKKIRRHPLAFPRALRSTGIVRLCISRNRFDATA